MTAGFVAMFPLRTTLLLLFIPGNLGAQARAEPSIRSLAFRLSSIPAVTGYEQALVDTLLRLLPGARRDRAGNAVLVLGQGNPKRLLACPLDEPGYVVGHVREDGYLTLRRSPGKVGPLFDQQLEGHRVTVQGRRAPVEGVVAVRSVHLTRGRAQPSEDPFTVDDAFVDVGAGSKAEVERLGVSVLAPVTLTKRPHVYGDSLLAAPVAGRRVACAALVATAREWVAGSKTGGTVIVAFVVAQELGYRGLATVANQQGPFEETLIVDRVPGDGMDRGPLSDAELSLRWPKLGRVSRLSLPARYTGTAVETISLTQAESLRQQVKRRGQL